MNPVRQRISKTSRPDGDLNSTAGDMEPNQEMSKGQLPSRQLVRKTPPSGVDEKHPDSQIEHVEQTPVDAPSQPTVEFYTASFFPASASMSNPTPLNETTEPRGKQPRIGERVYPSPLPMPIPSTSHSQNIAETARQVDDLVQDPEDEKEEMMLVTTVAPGPHSEGCLLAGARREIYPSSPEWSTPTGRELIAKGIKVETDMLIHDKRALVPLSLEESALVPKESLDPSRMVLVENFDDDGNRFVKARLTARGDQDPELLSLVIASLGADLELGDVTRAFLEPAEFRRQGGKLFLRQPSCGLPGLHPQQLLEIRLPLYVLNDSPKRWFLEVSNFLRNIGWKSSALDECVFIFFDPESKVLAGILCLHVHDLLLGGCGTACRQTINALRSRFPFRKWKRNQGEFSPRFPGCSHQRDHCVSEYLRFENQQSDCSSTSPARRQGNATRN